MDPIKIAVVGAGRAIGQPGFAFMEELRQSGVQIVEPDVPRPSFFIPDSRSRNTGAARIKRNAKQRRRRKG